MEANVNFIITVMFVFITNTICAQNKVDKETIQQNSNFKELVLQIEKHLIYNSL